VGTGLIWIQGLRTATRETGFMRISVSIVCRCEIRTGIYPAARGSRVGNDRV